MLKALLLNISLKTSSSIQFDDRFSFEAGSEKDAEFFGSLLSADSEAKNDPHERLLLSSESLTEPCFEKNPSSFVDWAAQRSWPASIQFVVWTASKIHLLIQ